jgi:hypothetical protein
VKRERAAKKRDEERRVKNNKKCRRRRCRIQKGCVCLSQKKSRVPEGKKEEEVSTDSRVKEEEADSESLKESPQYATYFTRVLGRGVTV